MRSNRRNSGERKESARIITAAALRINYSEEARDEDNRSKARSTEIKSQHKIAEATGGRQNGRDCRRDGERNGTIRCRRNFKSRVNIRNNG